MVDILMATYNGEKYIAEQIESISKQTYKDWHLVIRDDCSTDTTWEIVKKYRDKYSCKIEIVKADTPSGGATQNFFRLLDYAKCDYVMFCDQDDVWMKDKIIMELDRIKRMEHRYGIEKPLLVYTDLKRVDEKLNNINLSSCFQKSKSDYDGLNGLIAQDLAYGCTMLFNHSLLNLLNVRPKKAVGHDTWVCMVASAFGKIEYIDKQTMFYRRHENNVSDIRPSNKFTYCLKEYKNLRNVQKILTARYEQAGEFLKIYNDKLSQQQKEMLKFYSQFDSMNCIQRCVVLRKYHLFKNGLVRQLGQIFL